ncbi:PRTRC system protein E [Chryseobacterium sp. SL1]|uniref:PRTRC system protein E n=1 Tax=Chryseobacterium sp. SL1 TaxID=2995159 RepID=UPI002273A7BD|nr:PRTRC system protein E [Chryseobacterium sp. SL1]MCY1662569.1 PRTRC system protein E [Chryseobacterium sp. SL1]
MNANFFKQIAKMDVNSRLMLTIAKKDHTNLIVSVLVQNEACGDKAKNIIPPLNICGTAEELDEGFFETIRTPVQTATGLMTNMQEFMKQLEVAKQHSAMVKDKAEKETKEKEAKAKKYTDAIQKAETLEKEGKFKEAWTALPKISDFPEQSEDIRRRMSEIEKFLAPSLFGEPIE